MLDWVVPWPWTQLRKFGKNRILRSSYIWLFLFPLIAKIVEGIEYRVSVLPGGQPFEIEFEMPFTWTLLYFAALLFTFGLIPFVLCSPYLVREYRDFQEFENEGRSAEDLAVAMREHMSQRSFDEDFSVGISNPNIDLSQKYGWATDAVDLVRPLARGCCTYSNLAGLGLVTYILAENFLYVLSTVWP